MAPCKVGARDAPTYQIDQLGLYRSAPPNLPLRQLDADWVGAVGALPEDRVERDAARGQTLQPHEEALGVVRPPTLGVVANAVGDGALLLPSPPIRQPRLSSCCRRDKRPRMGEEDRKKKGEPSDIIKGATNRLLSKSIDVRQ